MKISKTLLGGVALLGMTGLASAQTKIYVTGSSAFRASTNLEIDNLLAAGGGTITKASDNATFASANAITWTGGNISGTPVTIKASFSGSGAGIQTVAGTGFTVGFLPDGAAGTANADPRNAANPREAAAPDIALSDVFQGSTRFNGTFSGVSYAALTDNIVGVVAFTFAGSVGFPTGLNMSPQIAQTLYPGGAVPLSVFTGSAGDEFIGVVATGRDPDSGTRLTAMAETNVGVNTRLRQYRPTVSGGSVTALNLYPASTINGINYVAGDGGESSGGSLRAYLPNTVSAAAVQQVDGSYTGGYLVTYLGVSDFNAVSSTAVPLRYNGVVESQTGIIEGSYTFWGYEHLFYKSSLGGIKSTFATRLATQITNSSSATLAPNVSVNDMKVQRSGDGSTVSSLLH